MEPVDPELLAHIAPDLRPLALPVGTLKPDPRNARKHGGRNLAALTESLRVHGQRKPVVVQRSTGIVVAGNGTLACAQALGWLYIAASVQDMDDRTAAAYALADNRTAELAEWDEAVLAETLRELAAGDDGLSGVGLASSFDPGELDALLSKAAEGLSDAAGATETPTLDAEAASALDDEVPAAPDAARSEPGRIYQLGPHRLLCGDSTDAGLVAQLFGDDRARLVLTDPPYGIAYQSDLSPEEAKALKRRTDRKVVQNDALEPEALRSLIERALLAGRYLPGAAIYASVASGNVVPWIMRALGDGGFPFRWTLVWVKDQFVLGRADYHHRHELILYGWRSDGPHYFTDDRTQDTVLEYARPKRSAEHPTMKPIGLWSKLLANSTEPGDVVYDPFAGSGTTVIAAHALGRRARVVELDPAYCDVIRRRYGDFARSRGEDPGPDAL